MRVVITGGAGQLGINVCKTFLQDGLQVRVFDLDTAPNRKSIKELGGKAEILWGDITQPDSVRDALREVDAVVHMAAILPPLADEKPELTSRVNVGGTRILVDLIKEKGSHIPLVFTSSATVFGPTPNAAEPLSSDKDAPHPKGAYAETKFEAENVIRESGVDYVILRLSAAMPLIFSVGDIKRLFIIPLDNRIEFCHSDDTSLAIVNSVKNFGAVKGNTLLISGGPDQQMLYKDMTGAMLRVMGLPLPPARKFRQEPYYLDWYDTSKSQELLHFQRKTFADYLEDYSKELNRRYSPVFVPIMRYFIGPVLGKIIVQFM